MQRLLSSEQLASVGKDLESALKDAVKICALPSTAAELRPKRDSGS
jgi:hypothetical protein